MRLGQTEDRGEKQIGRECIRLMRVAQGRSADQEFGDEYFLRKKRKKRNAGGEEMTAPRG